MTRGKFITVEGTEGAGKSTSLAFIKTYLAAANIETIMTREPGGTPLAEDIRKVLLYPDNAEKVMPATELLLMFAGRSQHIHHCILPALNAGKWVVSDRYIDASYAYQGGGRGIDIEHIASLDRWIVADAYPDLTLLLDIPPELGAARTVMRGSQKDRIEKEKIEFFMRVRNAYLERARQDPERIKIIDASLVLESVHAQIQQALAAFIERQ